MGMEVEYKNNKLKVKTWGNTDRRNAEWIAESAMKKYDLQKSGGKYRDDSDSASAFKMELDLDRK